ncbi:MAG: protein jag [Firmicutes bacterium]|nr:protein jag [Bacillota bacterium]
MRYSEKWGDSIDSAVALALQDLKLTREQVTVTVLEEPSKGFFGIGSKLAKVRVEEIAPEKPAVEEKPAKPEKKDKEERKAEAPKSQAKEETREKRASEKPAKKKDKKPRGKREFKIEGEAQSVSAKPADLVDMPEHPAKAFLTDLIREMGLEASVKVAANADSVYADIEGADTGTIIGKRGQTLDSIQYLTSLVVNKGEDEYIRVVVDAEGYRAKREATLEKLAYKLAEKSVRTGRSVKLEPMNPYERKVIHTTLQTVPAVVTRSEGSEPHRRVVIEPAKK